MPNSALLTVHSIPDAFKSLHEGISVHGLLASFLAFGGEETSRYSHWRSTWPSFQDFQTSMPIMWPECLREPLGGSSNPSNMMKALHEPFPILPRAIGGKWSTNSLTSNLHRKSLLYQQNYRIQRDWKIVSAIFPQKTFSDYTYHWLIVNTRSFYFDIEGGHRSKNHKDRMVLCPFIDYFNHSDHGVSKTLDTLK